MPCYLTQVNLAYAEQEPSAQVLLIKTDKQGSTYDFLPMKLTYVLLIELSVFFLIESTDWASVHYQIRGIIMINLLFRAKCNNSLH